MTKSPTTANTTKTIETTTTTVGSIWSLNLGGYAKFSEMTASLMSLRIAFDEPPGSMVTP
jgi:hypothetical protein